MKGSPSPTQEARLARQKERKKAGSGCPLRWRPLPSSPLLLLFFCRSLFFLLPFLRRRPRRRPRPRPRPRPRSRRPAPFLEKGGFLCLVSLQAAVTAQQEAWAPPPLPALAWGAASPLLRREARVAARQREIEEQRKKARLPRCFLSAPPLHTPRGHLS